MTKSNPLISKDRFVPNPAHQVMIGPGAKESLHSENDSVAVNVVRDGNDVKYIEVQCECGKITRIVCEYE